jgi:hypothetical protein
MKTKQERRDQMIAEFEESKKKMSKKEKKEVDELFAILDDDCKHLRVIRNEISNKIREIDRRFEELEDHDLKGIVDTEIKED